MKAEQVAIVRRIFTAAIAKHGSAAQLAAYLGVSLADLQLYLDGEAMPADFLLLRTVNLLLEELPTIRKHFSAAAWISLALPHR